MFVDSAHLLKIYALDYLKTRKCYHRVSELSRKPVCLVSDVWQRPSPTCHALSIVSADSRKAEKFGLTRELPSLLTREKLWMALLSGSGRRDIYKSEF